MGLFKDVVKSFFFGNVFGIFVNYECDFWFEISRVGSDKSFGDNGRGRKGIGERCRRFYKKGGDIGYGKIDFFGVVNVLEIIIDD